MASRTTVSLEGAFECGGGLQQAAQAVDLTVAFERQVVVEAGEDLEPRHGLVVCAAVAQRVGHVLRGERDYVCVARVGLGVAGQQLRRLAHRCARQVADLHAHGTRHRQRQ